MSYFSLGQVADDSFDEARERVEALKAKLAARRAAEVSEPVKTMTNGSPPPAALPGPAPAALTQPRVAYQPQFPPQPAQENGARMKNVLSLLGVGLVAGVAVVILQRAFRRNN